MTDQTQALAGDDLQLQARRLIAEMQASVASREQHWFLALAEAIRAWPLANETLGGRTYRYLVGGEAFDWLLLAERLAPELADLVPEEEIEELLFRGCLPEDVEAEDLQPVLGAKYRAHLNFVYGVRVETALHLAVQEEVNKERMTRIWENGHLDEEVFRRIYGWTKREMLAAFHEKNGIRPNDTLSLADLSEFTYWLFRHRVQNCDPARVASDTRKGLAYLQHLESLRKRRTGAAGL